MVWTKQKFDRVFNNHDIKQYSAKQIQTSLLAKEPMIQQICTLVDIAQYYCKDSDGQNCNKVVEDHIKWIISLNFLEGVPYTPMFWLDFGYALQALKSEHKDYLRWWHHEKHCVALSHFERYRGMRFHQFLKEYHNCDWSKIALKMKPYKEIHPNNKPTLR